MDLKDRFRGVLVGIGVGDALGRSRGREASRGTPWIEHYVPRRGYTSGRVGTPTFETMMTEWLAESFIEKNGFEPQDIMERFVAGERRAAQDRVPEFIANYRERHLPWYQAGAQAFSCPGQVRVAPIGLYYYNAPHFMWVAAEIQSIIVQNNATSIAAAVLLSQAIAILLKTDPGSLRTIESRVKLALEIARAIEGIEFGAASTARQPSASGATLYRNLAARIPSLLRLRAAAGNASVDLQRNTGDAACVLFALYCFLKTPTDFARSLLDAVNWSRFPNAVGSITCALSGALNGAEAIPSYYTAELAERERLVDLADALLYRAQQAAGDAI